MFDEPIVRSFAAPPPDLLFARLAGRRRPFFLDSGTGGARLGRYSFLGADPFLTFASRGCAVDLVTGGRQRRLRADPLQTLERLLCRYALPPGDCPVPFAGGAVGYLGYDLGRLIEPASAGPRPPPDDLRLPDSVLCFYDALVAYDHVEGAAYLVSTGLPEPPGAARRDRAQRRLAELEAMVCGERHPPAGPPPLAVPAAEPVSAFSRPAYLAAVQRARDYIIAGDCYQVNLAQRFHAPWPGTPWDLHRRVRAINPAPFAACLGLGRFAIVSASPERFLSLCNGVIETRPIKGTRPRGCTPEEDARLARELLASVKDRAEHIMIVDLERNDLGRVAEVGSVTVDELMTLESYATVHHLVSTVRARLRPGRGVAGLLRATFPGGSITGAPKVRAMQIIDELEPVRRGVYTGAIGYLSATGSLDLNIAIRTLVIKDGVAYVHLGGAIVYDSDPEAEYQETLDKGRALFQALGGGPSPSCPPRRTRGKLSPEGRGTIPPSSLGKGPGG